MIGKYQLEFNEKQFTAGISTNDTTSDGGLAPSSKGTNLTLSPGSVFATAAETGITSGQKPHGNLIASCEDIWDVPYNRILVDDTGYFYYLNGSGAFALNQITNTSSSSGFVSGFTDLVAFHSTDYNYYCTRAGDITKLKYTHSSSTLTDSWWQTTKGQAPLLTGGGQANPLLVYNQVLWVADGNLLHNIDTSEAVTRSVLVLSPNEVIVALGIDPSTGLMMISTVSGANYSDTQGSKFWVYLYDGVSAKPTRKIPVDDMILSFHANTGRVYCGYSNNLGLWNGNGVSYLRTLNNVPLAGAQLPYKHKVTSFKNTLLIADGTQVLAYGAINQASSLQQNAAPVFYYPYYAQLSPTFLSMLAYTGSGILCVGYLDGSTKECRLTDLTSASAGTATLALQSTYFPRPVFIRRMRVVTSGITTTAGIGDTSLQDEFSINHQCAVHKFVVLSAQSPRYVFDFDFTNLKLQTLQPTITIDTQHFSVRRVIFYYDIAE